MRVIFVLFLAFLFIGNIALAYIDVSAGVSSAQEGLVQALLGSIFIALGYGLYAWFDRKLYL